MIERISAIQHQEWSRGKLALYLLTVFLMQMPGVFLGFELLDSGFYLTFYDNIFAHPESVQFNFMYYLSGVVGWLLLRLTGGSMLGMRIAGALCYTLCAWIVYDLLKRHSGLLPLTCGAVIVCAGAWISPATFNNDTLTMVLALASLSLMLKGLQPHISMKALMWSGVIAGINAWSRMPNILEVAFVVIIPLTTLRETGWRRCLSNCCIWIAAWLAGVASVFLFASAAGHRSMIMEVIQDLFDAGNSQGDESSHSIFRMLGAYFKIWGPICKLSIKIWIMAAYLVFVRNGLLANKLREGSSAMRSMMFFPVFFVLCWCEWRIIAGNEIYLRYTTIYFAIALTGAGLALIVKDKLLRMSALAGLVTLTVIPLGSDGGFYNIGTPLLWLALPVAFTVIYRLTRFLAPGATVTILAITLLWPAVESLAEGHVYFDDAPLTEKTHPVRLEHTGGILSSRYTATHSEDMVRGLLTEVSPGDTVMIYGGMPMFNYLTGTIPALGCSWPELLSPGQLSNKLDRHPAPPYIVMTKRHTFNIYENRHVYPELYLRGYFITPDGKIIDNQIYHNVKKSGIMLRYINENGYRKVTETPSYVLYRRGDAK